MNFPGKFESIPFYESITFERMLTRMGDSDLGKVTGQQICRRGEMNNMVRPCSSLGTGGRVGLNHDLNRLAEKFLVAFQADGVLTALETLQPFPFHLLVYLVAEIS